MEAKDTVMGDDELEAKIRKDYKDFRVRDECGYNQDILCWTREAQAEISFGAGADAMLEYLFSQEHQDWLATPEGELCKGKWVFIPVEQVKKDATE